MKNFNRVMAIVFALCMVLTMGAWAQELPVSEDVDWGFENGPDNNYSSWNANYIGSAKLGKPYINRAYSENAANVHSGARSLCLYNNGEDPNVDVASVYTAAPRLKAFGTADSITVPANSRVLFEGYVKVAELGEGAHVDVIWHYRAWDYSTTVATYTEADNTWHKFSWTPAWWTLSNDKSKTGYITLKLTGTGTAYFDDIFCGLTDNVVPDGDFEIGATSAQPTGWTWVNRTNGAVWGADGTIGQEEDGNRYLIVKNTSTTKSKEGWIYTPIKGVKGAQYVITARFKTTSAATEPPITFGTAANSAGWAPDMFSWEKLSEDANGWGTFRGTCVLPDDATDYLLVIKYTAGWGNESYYDDITLSIDSTPVLSENEGTVTAVSHVVALGDRPTTLFIAVYEKEADATLKLVDISSVETEAIDAGQTVKLEKSVTVPQDEKTYCVKAFLWNELSALQAQTPSVTLGE